MIVVDAVAASCAAGSKKEISVLWAGSPYTVFLTQVMFCLA